MSGWRRDSSRKYWYGVRRSPYGSDSSDDDSDGIGYRADSPTYRQVEREIESYLQQVRRSDPPAERLFKSFSPTDSLTSSPLRSPDVSPPSWRFSAPSPGSASPGGSSAGSFHFSPPVSPGSSQFSPPVSPAGTGPLSPPFSGSLGPSQSYSPAYSPRSPSYSPTYSPNHSYSPPVAPAEGPVSPMDRHEGPGSPQWIPRERVFPPLSCSDRRSSGSESSTPSARRADRRSPPLGSPGGSSSRPSKRRRLYSAEVSAEPARRADEQDWLLLLLSRESQSERPDRQLAGGACCRALVDYLRLAPQAQPRAARILARLGR